MKMLVRIAAVFGAVAAIAATLTLSSGQTEAIACNQPMDSSGRVAAGNTTSYSVKFCSDPSHSFAVYVSWGSYSSSKDLALRVTDPNGTVYMVDNDPNASEVFFAYAPLPEGDWTVEVINQGTRNVRFDIIMGFG